VRDGEPTALMVDAVEALGHPPVFFGGVPLGSHRDRKGKWRLDEVDLLRIADNTDGGVFFTPNRTDVELSTLDVDVLFQPHFLIRPDPEHLRGLADTDVAVPARSVLFGSRQSPYTPSRCPMTPSHGRRSPPCAGSWPPRLWTSCWSRATFCWSTTTVPQARSGLQGALTRLRAGRPGAALRR
jgi:hypothetical protein